MYSYPDKSDMLTMELINQEFDGVYWGKSEAEVLSHATAAVDAMNGPKTLLDLGCGIGRLFETFCPHVELIQAVEPDKQRFAEAETVAKKWEGKVNVEQGDISVLKQDTQRFKIVLMSHILQHIKEETIIGMLEELEFKQRKMQF